MRTLLRFIACGSVDDGKSTLIGRLLHDTGSVPEDQLAAARAESRRAGHAELDLSLLTDGLAAEREQGITIDVAYRFFSTPARSFIVADAPGHEQYTRNMVTGASTADLALIVVDARKGVLPQTRRHGYLAKLLGVRHFVLAVTKMDLVGEDQAVFDAIVADYADIAEGLGLPAATALPLSGWRGDNVARASDHMPWYAGPTLIGHLEQVEPEADPGHAQPFAMPVQWVNRARPGFRGLAGTVARGAARPGDRVRLLPSGSTTTISRILTLDGDLDAAGQGQAVTLTLADEVECGRGEVICAAEDSLEVSDQFEATLVWMAEEPMLPGRSYWLKLGCSTVSATVTALRHEVGLATLEKQAARSLAMNAIGVVNIALDRPLPFAPYAESRDLGGFLLIDRATEQTLGAGMIRFALRRSHNLHWQAVEVTPAAHAAQKGQRPLLLWFTGLSGAGKSTIANLVEKRLFALGRHSFLLDGDNLRHGLNRDLGFTDADRAENIRRVGEVAKLMTEAGLIVLAAFISPFRAERDAVRRLLPEGAFVEIHVDTPLEEAARRDTKGLYRKAQAGLIRNFTGIDSPYEPPLDPEIRIDTTTTSAEEAAERIVVLCLAREGG